MIIQNECLAYQDCEQPALSSKQTFNGASLIRQNRSAELPRFVSSFSAVHQFESTASPVQYQVSVLPPCSREAERGQRREA